MSDNHKDTPQKTNKIRNPFDKVLIDRLHKPICSPGMCKIYKKANGPFRWDIDQVCMLKPADIVACNSQFEPSPDPTFERIAEEATERFFSQEMVMPSPLETSKKIKPTLNKSCDASIQIGTMAKAKMVSKTVQTALSLPPKLPSEIEKTLESYYTYKQESILSDEYEITENESLRRTLYFEEHSDMEQTDDEHPISSFEAHKPVVNPVFSPDLCRDLVAKGMTRTFGTPMKQDITANANKPFRNKILDVTDGGCLNFSPIEFRTPKRDENSSATCSSSLASTSISPINKAASSDDEKNNFSTPETDTLATCLNCVQKVEAEKTELCHCKFTPIKIQRSASLKDSPEKIMKSCFSFSKKRSHSLSSLCRSRSVQKLDFSFDMSIEADSESSPPQSSQDWQLVEESTIHHLVKINTDNAQNKQTCLEVQNTNNIIEETPIKGKSRISTRSHEISKIRAPLPPSPMHMSLDNSFDMDLSDNPLQLEDKNIDFNTVDLKFLTENVTQFNYTNKVENGDCTSSFKRFDSGFTDNTFYTNASSYYESAIKPSELAVTKCETSKGALKEISNVNWMRVDSGFKDENSSDSQMYATDNSVKKYTSFHFIEANKLCKENVPTEDFDKFLVQSSHRNDATAMSDIFDGVASPNFKFSSTPSKN